MRNLLNKFVRALACWFCGVGWKSKESWRGAEECRRGGSGRWGGRGGVELFSCGYIRSGEGGGKGGVGNASDRVERDANKNTLRAVAAACGLKAEGLPTPGTGGRVHACGLQAGAISKQTNKTRKKKTLRRGCAVSQASIMHAYT